MAGILIGDLISEHKILVGPRYWLYRVLQNTSVRAPTYSNQLCIVTIGDQEYWQGPLARRTPLKRTYLADLLCKLDALNPKVIALDVDLGALETGAQDDYVTENETLINKIKKVRAKVVLAKALISPGNTEGFLIPIPREYKAAPTIFDHVNFDQERVQSGFAALPYDIRQVPLVLTLKDGSPMYSFAAAVAQAVDAEAVKYAQSKDKDTLPYGTFISDPGFMLLSANDVINVPSDNWKTKVAGNIVLIGGAWHEHAFGQGNLVDLHQTPVGEIGGVYVHANYIEALLTHWTFKPLGKYLSLGIEIFLSTLIAVICAWEMPPRTKLVWTALVSVVLILFTYVFWQNLGLFFDFSIPLILLGAHAGVERVLEWRSDSQNYAKQKHESEQCHEC
jgi:CHASE2 domain-containing sensor protein